MTHARTIRALATIAAVICLSATRTAMADAATAPTTTPASDRIDFAEETLANGLHVIYAPLHQAPVVHVRVIYHVGSRDERPDRQGFAHMFEHMMFRGSAHVAPEEHMKLVGAVGGNCNAFTSFDQTVYFDTLPADHLDMALYLEADRMASFKVSEEIYKTERKVVAEEWRMKQNRPYGNVYDQFLKSAFTAHSYRWTPIGNMDHLRAAKVEELQDFFNAYYLPNNATLLVAGDIDLAKAKESVRRCFAWIPAGPDVRRSIPVEPPQTSARQATVYDRVPLPMATIGYRLPPYREEDHAAVSLLADILGGGHSSRLERLLVNNEQPLAVDASASEMRLEDAGILFVNATVLQGRDPHAVEQVLAGAVGDVVEHGVTQEELDKAKTQERVALVRGRETATSLAEQLGEDAVFGGDAARVNGELSRIDAVTVADVQAIAKAYCPPANSTTLLVRPDPLGTQARAAASAAATQAQAAKDAPVSPATRPAETRQIAFPSDWPAHAPSADKKEAIHLDKGVETQVDGIRVIVIADPRLPVVNWSITTRRGGYADPKGKEGLSGLTADMLLRGAGNLSYAGLSNELESHGIALQVHDGGDFTVINGSCITSELGRALDRTRDVLLAPAMPADEFAHLKDQTLSELELAQESPTSVAQKDLSAALYGDSPLGRAATPRSVQSITLDDVKACYARNLSRNGAIVLLSGDVTLARGREVAAKLLTGWKGDPGDAAPLPDYTPTTTQPAGRRIILVDRPSGKQSTVRMGVRAYDIHSEDKYAGSVAGQVLTSGIDSRLGRYVRAEKGLCYSVYGQFHPGRHGGEFLGGVDTAVESTADAVEAMFKVFDDMRKADITADELAQARTRTAGALLMTMQTVEQQAGLRVDGLLNNYPIDYYDQYPARLARVTPDEVRNAMTHYVNDDQFAIVVVAPAAAVKDQLERLGHVEVVPMPAQRASDAASRPSNVEMMKPAQ